MNKKCVIPKKRDIVLFLHYPVLIWLFIWLYKLVRRKGFFFQFLLILKYENFTYPTTFQVYSSMYSPAFVFFYIMSGIAIKNTRFCYLKNIDIAHFLVSFLPYFHARTCAKLLKRGHLHPPPHVALSYLQLSEDIETFYFLNYKKQVFEWPLGLLYKGWASRLILLATVDIRSGFVKDQQILARLFKWTVLRDRFQKCWRKLTDLGLNKGRGWFLNFSKVPLIFSWNKTCSIR